MLPLPNALAHLPLLHPAALTQAPPLQPAPTTQSLPVAGSTNDVAPDELDNPAALKQAFSERCNWQLLADNLGELLKELNDAFPGEVSDRQPGALEARLATHLATSTLPVCEGSRYSRQHNLAPNSRVKLGTFLSGSGVPAPKTLEALLALYQVATKQVQTFPLGNYGGALSWPIPLSAQDRQALIDLLNTPDPALPELPLTDKQGVLGYLCSVTHLSSNDFKFPASAMEMLLGSTKAQALGQFLQARLGGIATNTSVNDYLLAAIALGLDPQALGTPARNSVSGFDLGQRALWNQPPNVAIEGLSRHLVKEGRASKASADLAARLLLARTAPQYLVKDIPPNVTYASVAWTQLEIAVAKLEAESPGRAFTMTYSEVLAAAETTDVGAALTQTIHREALHNWGIVNGYLKADTSPSDTQMRATQTAFSNQQQSLQATAQALATPIPMREEMGMQLLREKFPGVPDDVFRAKHLTKARLVPGRPGRFPGTHSMLDVVMQGAKVDNSDSEHWITQDKRIPIMAFCALSDSGVLSVADAFDQHYKPAMQALEKGHAGMTQHLISTLPPQDRENFEYGQLEFFHTNDYFIEADFSSKTLIKKGHTLDVKITRNGQVNIYRIDTRAGNITKHNYLAHIYSPPYSRLDMRDANTLHRTVRFNPFADEHAQRSKETPARVETPQVFDSERTRYIAKVLTQRLDLHGDDLLQHARGTTSYDKTSAANQAIGEFFLNMIPFRSAIVNFMQGNIGDGLMDLGLDVIGLVTLGAGKAAQAGKVLSKGVFGVKGVARTARFVGTVALEALNPLGGAGDLLKGISRWAWSKGTKAFNTLRGATGSYDLLKAASTQHGLVSTGTARIAGHDLEMGAVFQGGNWHAFDAAKGLPYGPPLQHFQPSVVAANGELKVLNTPSLQGYEATVSADLLQVKGLQGNVYVGPNNKEYVKVDGTLYESNLNEGQRFIRHPSGTGVDLPIKDVGVAGWEPISRGHRLPGGAPTTTHWRLSDDTFVVPLDDVKITRTGASPYAVHYKGRDHTVTFDTQVGAWKSEMSSTHVPGSQANTGAMYFWRTGKGKWRLGSVDEFNHAKKIKTHKHIFVNAPSISLTVPPNAKPIPKEIHYFWAGGHMNPHLQDNIRINAVSAPGYKSIVHVDANDQRTFVKLKNQLEANKSGVEVRNLHKDDVFQQLKSSDMYAYFRQGQGTNLAAASDVARYPIMKKYGGIYLDTDDSIVATVKDTELRAAPNDILLNSPVAIEFTDYKNFYNTSNFATQPHNPVIDTIISEMRTRFANNKDYFTAHRPTVQQGETPNAEFYEYERKIFETVGPDMFNDILKSRRPDMYDLGFDRLKEVTLVDNKPVRNGPTINIEAVIHEQYKAQGIVPPSDTRDKMNEVKTHYFPFDLDFKIKNGNEHSWMYT